MRRRDEREEAREYEYEGRGEGERNGEKADTRSRLD